jgi:PilZ domain
LIEKAAQIAEKRETTAAANHAEQTSAMPGQDSISGQASASVSAPVPGPVARPIPVPTPIPASTSTPNPNHNPIHGISMRSTAVPEEPPDAQPAQRQPWQEDEVPRTWLERVLLGDNRDPRTFPRLSPPELFAYFFTGGPPAAHRVRNISTSGLYIVTGERWYLGTIVQLTLTDRLRPKGAQSISLFAKVVRTGIDGVGLKFLLEGLNRRRVIRYDVYEPTNGISVSHIGEFMKQFGTA